MDIELFVNFSIGVISTFFFIYIYGFLFIKTLLTDAKISINTKLELQILALETGLLLEGIDWDSTEVSTKNEK